MIKVQRVYESSQESGYRILVDRIWPRGVRKEELHFDLWLKNIAPSTSLRKWFGHDPQKWKEFKRSYFKELESKEADIGQIKKHKNAVLLFAAKDTEHNNAVALKEYLESKS